MADRYYLCTPEIFRRLKKETQALFERYPEDDGVMVFLPDKRVQQLEARIRELTHELAQWRTGAKALYPSNEIRRNSYHQEKVRQLCIALHGYEFKTYTDVECDNFTYLLLHLWEVHDINSKEWAFREVRTTVQSRIKRGQDTFLDFLKDVERWE